MTVLVRIGVWFGCVLIAAALFSALFIRVGSVWFIFKVTLVFALPVGFLYLPFVLAFKDAEERRIWPILLSGILIGPASMFLWGLVLELRGEDAHLVWQGDGLGTGVFQEMIYATVVGLFTTVLYVVWLKVIHHIYASRIKKYSV
jgi:hypothetical protein